MTSSSILLSVTNRHCDFGYIFCNSLKCFVYNQPLKLLYQKKAALKNLAIFTGQHVRWSLFLINCRPGGLQLYSKKTPTQLFSYEYWEVFMNSFFIEHLRWLILCRALIWNFTSLCLSYEHAIPLTVSYIYSSFWLVNILLQKFETSSKKETRMIKTNFLMKNTKKCQEIMYKVAFSTVNSPHWLVM